MMTAPDPSADKRISDPTPLDALIEAVRKVAGHPRRDELTEGEEWANQLVPTKLLDALADALAAFETEEPPLFGLYLPDGSRYCVSWIDRQHLKSVQRINKDLDLRLVEFWPRNRRES
jgi:hypothetical protein